MKKGAPTVTLAPEVASTIKGKSVPSKTAKAIAKKSTFPSKKLPSRLTGESRSLRSRIWSHLSARSPNDTSITTMKKPKKYGPTGPSPNACTEEMMPERMMKVPRMVSANVRMIRSRFQALSIRLRSCTCTL